MMKEQKKLLPNMALMFGVGLLPLLFLTLTLKTALIYAVMLFLVMLFSELIMGAFKVIINSNVRYIIYAFVVISVVYFIDSAVYELFPKNYNNLHFIVVMLFGASVVFYSLETNITNMKFKSAVGLTIKMGGEYALTIILMGLIREVLAFGTLWGKTLGNFKGIKFFSSIAGALLIVFVFAVVYNLIAQSVEKRIEVYNQLTRRYSEVLKKNSKNITASSTETNAGEDK